MQESCRRFPSPTFILLIALALWRKADQMLSFGVLIRAEAGSLPLS